MTRATRILFSLILAGALISSASADMLSLVGLGNFSNQSYSSLPAGKSLSSSTSFAPGGGALFDFHFMPSTMFEVGALYVTQKYNISGSTNMSFDGNYLQIPVLFRIRVMPMFYLGAGGFGERGIGTPSAGNFSKLTDFGLEGSLGFQLPLTDATRLRLEGRYLYGLTNLDTSGDGGTIEGRDIQVVVGIAFPLSYH